MNERGPDYRRWYEMSDSVRDIDHHSNWKADIGPSHLSSLAICRLGLYSPLSKWWECSVLDVTQRNHCGESPLILAALEGHAETVELLLDNGADINAQGGYYGNVLQAASYQDRTENVRILLDNGADVHAQG
jgi:ankyrin repeat protein